MIDEFTEDAIGKTLRGSYGWRLRFFREIGSTNTEAMAWAAEEGPHGALVAADHQTEGRGRWGRGWESQPGKLLQFSVLLRPELPLQHAGLLSVAAGVACSQGIEEASGVPATLKWPNDVLVNDRKVAGMLIETETRGDEIALAVIGIGINVGWTDAEMPAEIAETATSLAIACSASYLDPPLRTTLLASVLVHLERLIEGLPDNAEQLRRIATDRSSVIGHDVTIRFANGDTIEGRAKGLAADGALEVDTADGSKTVHVAEVEQVRQIG